MNLIFWNINKKDLTEELQKLTQAYNADILLLAESDLSEAKVLLALNDGQKRKFLLPLNLSDNIKIYTRFNQKSVIPISDDRGISIKHIMPPLGIDFILVAVHLPSKLHFNEIDQTFNAVRIANIIIKAEEKVGHDRTVIIGDFNMNPFENGMVSADGLHAVMDKNIAMKNERMVQSKKRKFFYNPMWSFLGDISKGPPGTYHYSKAEQACLFWNTFDQVLLRPSILKYFSDDNIEVVSKYNNTSLLGEDNKPNSRKFSDHLPVYLKLNIEG